MVRPDLVSLSRLQGGIPLGQAGAGVVDEAKRTVNTAVLHRMRATDRSVGAVGPVAARVVGVP